MNALLLDLGPAALVATVVLPAAAALAVAAWARLSHRLVIGATGVAALGAGLTAVAAWSEPITAGGAEAGLVADRVLALVIVLVAGVAAVVTSFAGRSLRGEPYERRFAVLAGLLTSASLVVATSTTLIGVAGAWLVVSAVVVALVGLTGTPGARAAARRTRRTLAVGDGALVGAVAVLALAGGVRLDGGAADVAAGPATMVGLLILVAAVTRSALAPAHRWLPETVWAPTPVSALLHAGVVNAGGLLLVRTWPTIGGRGVVVALTLAIGAATVVVGTLHARARGDVKGALAASTVAQMGFMTVTCALGAHAATIFHLVAHGWFKAALFLGSGTAVATGERARRFPALTVPVAPAWRAASVAVPALATAGVGVTVWSGAHHGVTLAGDLLVGAVLVAAASAMAGTGLRRASGTARRLVAVALPALVAAGYLGAVHALAGALSADLPGAGAAPGAWALAPVLVAMAATAAVVRGRAGTRLATRLYATLAAPPPPALVPPLTRAAPSASPASAAPTSAPMTAEPSVGVTAQLPSAVTRGPAPAAEVPLIVIPSPAARSIDHDRPVVLDPPVHDPSVLDPTGAPS